MHTNPIETASIADIANYLNDLKEIAGRKTNWVTDEEGWYGDVDPVAYETWKALYDKVFSDEISKVIEARFKDFQWYCPDTSYHDDVCAFIDRFSEYADSQLGEDGKELFPSFDTWKTNNT